MAKRHMILNGLLKNSAAAYFAAIEIHNKPNMEYRYETTTVLLLNAWELLLKAYVRKFTKKSMFVKSGRTIKFDNALQYTYDSMDKSGRLSFEATKANLEVLEEYRNTYAHYYDRDLDPILFSIIAKAAADYVHFFESYFGSKFLKDRNLYILPLGFTLPFEPQGFLGKASKKPAASREVNEFLGKIVEVTNNLQSKGVKDSIFVGFDIHFGNCKKVDNADLLACFDPTNGIPFTKTQTVRLSNKASAVPVNISDEDFFKMYPMDYGEFVAGCREKIPDFKLAKRFHDLKKTMLGKPEYCNSKSANKDHSNARIYYTEAAVDHMVDLWNASSPSSS